MTNAKKGGKKRGRKPKNTKLVDKPPPKKRGRKPKGGKIIKNFGDMNKNKIVKKTNVILHLKCSTHELDNTDASNPKPEFLNINNQTNISYNEINTTDEQKIEKKDVWEKIRRLKI